MKKLLSLIGMLVCFSVYSQDTANMRTVRYDTTKVVFLVSSKGVDEDFLSPVYTIVGYKITSTIIFEDVYRDIIKAERFLHLNYRPIKDFYVWDNKPLEQSK